MTTTCIECGLPFAVGTSDRHYRIFHEQSWASRRKGWAGVVLERQAPPPPQERVL